MSFFNVAKLKKKLIIGALKSDYAKRTYDFVPTWIISYILRFIVDFLFYFRLRFIIDPAWTLGWKCIYWPANMLVAVGISVIVTMSSPLFYDLVWQYKKHIKKFTNHIADRMTWNYYYIWQTRIALILSGLAIAILLMVEITSYWLIECIIHTLICGYILGQYEEWRATIMRPQVVYWEQFDASAKAQTAYAFNTAVPQYAKRAYYDTEYIPEYVAPSRAKVIKNVTKNQLNVTVKNKLQILNVMIFDDYQGNPAEKSAFAAQTAKNMFAGMNFKAAKK
jgi:hypothetical protein